MTLERVTVILIVFIWASDSLADHHHHHYHRSSRSTNEYILRKCIATAELIRKHRNEETVAVSSRKAEGNLLQPQVQQRNPDFVSAFLTDVSQPEVSKQSSIYRRMTHMRRRANGHARRITSKQLADTPLKTVNIDAPEDRPLAFKKKSPLPELAHDVSGRNIDPSPHVIIIKPVT
ncbi:hypothetical protein X777_06492 [Ooceraea biroi]|nr:hypothetical protein X777_06492 [Ooceraea biroi]